VTTQPLTLVIADDHAVVRQGLRLLLEAEPGLAVVGEASNVEETRAILRAHTPDVLVLDLHLRSELSLGTISELRSISPPTAIVILTMDDDPAFVAPAWAAGAAGYVLKEASRTDLVRAVRTIGGGRYLDPAIGGRALSSLEESTLSERELAVLRLVALGYSSTEIAKQLYISPRTVESHRASLHALVTLPGGAEQLQRRSDGRGQPRSELQRRPVVLGASERDEHRSRRSELDLRVLAGDQHRDIAGRALQEHAHLAEWNAVADQPAPALDHDEVDRLLLDDLGSRAPRTGPTRSRRPSAPGSARSAPSGRACSSACRSQRTPSRSSR
jgi:two-component system response regulator NreC